MRLAFDSILGWDRADWIRKGPHGPFVGFKRIIARLLASKGQEALRVILLGQPWR